MKPYYEDDMVCLYHGDAFEIVTMLPVNSVDMILTDPPYGVRWQSNRRPVKLSKVMNDDGSIYPPEFVRPFFPVLKNGRHIYVFGLKSFEDLPVSSSAEIIWDKGIVGLGDLSLPYGLSHETIRFAVHFKTKRQREKEGRLSARLRQGSVLRFQRKHGSQVSRHPTEKPVPLLRCLIESSSLIGETVFDPFVGSGSTLVAAKLEGRKAIGIEIVESLCEIAAERCRKVSYIEGD